MRRPEIRLRPQATERHSLSLPFQTPATQATERQAIWQVLLSDINDISGRYQCVLGQ